MSAVADKPTIDLFLLHFYNKFRKASPHATALKINHKIDKIRVCNQYCISSSAIHLESGREILLLGPKVSSLENVELVSAGTSLLAAPVIDLKAPQIIACGTKKTPMILVGLKSVSIRATTEAKIKNLTIYLSAQAVLDIDCASFAAFQNVKVVRVELEGKKICSRTQHDWQTHADLLDSVEENKAT